VNGYKLNDPRLIYGRNSNFLLATTTKPTLEPIAVGNWSSFPMGKSDQNMKISTHFHLV
jgi:hypothetical protein